MHASASYAEILRKRHTLAGGEVGAMLIHDLLAALDVKVKDRGLESLSQPERVVLAVGKLDDFVGSDPGWHGYLRSTYADDFAVAVQALRDMGAEGYAQLAAQCASIFGDRIPRTKAARVQALRALGGGEKRLLEQISSVWWQHNVRNSLDGDQVEEAVDAEPGTIQMSFTGPDGKKVVVDPAESSIPGVAALMKGFRALMKEAPRPPPPERGLDMRLVDYFVANLEAFDLPMTERDAARAVAVAEARAAIEQAGSAAEALLAFCAVPEPWIRTAPCGAGEPRRFAVRHLVGGPAGAVALRKLAARLGRSPDASVAAFYAQINGALLMRDGGGLDELAYPRRIENGAFVQYLNDAWSDEVAGHAGFALYPIELWDESTKSLRDWYEALMDADPDSDPDEYDWLPHAVSIGQVIHSADHFVLVTDGRLAGKVLFTDHETLEADIFAESFEELVGLVAASPTWFLQRVLSDWRFQDDDGEQFVPEAWME